MPEAIVKVIAAALEGDSLIPAGVAQALAAKPPAFEDPDWVGFERGSSALGVSVSAESLVATSLVGARRVFAAVLQQRTGQR